MHEPGVSTCREIWGELGELIPKGYQSLSALREWSVTGNRNVPRAHLIFEHGFVGFAVQKHCRVFALQSTVRLQVGATQLGVIIHLPAPLTDSMIRAGHCGQARGDQDDFTVPGRGTAKSFTDLGNGLS